MRYQLPLFTAITIVTAVYPLVVYFGINEFGPRALALFLLLVLCVRAAWWRAFSRQEIIIYLCLVGGLCLVVVVTQSEQLLRYYPVLMNLGIGCFFWASLGSQRPLVERFALLINKQLSSAAQWYMRRLTLVWAIILTVNAFISFYTACCMSMQHWALYNALIVYVIFGVVSVGELIVRHFYKKRHQ